MMDKSRNPVTPSVIDHGQNPSECKKKTGSLEMLELVVTTEREQMVKPPHELPIAQEKHNLSIVLTEISAGCPGGLGVSTADQYSQDLRFKTNHLH
jgi:hypothetical protein